MKPIHDISARTALWLVVLVLLGATFLRVNGMSSTPPGYAFDGSWDLSDALRISRGIPFPADFDTRGEPMHRWMIAFAYELFGAHVLSLQIVQFTIAILTVALTYTAGSILLQGQPWQRLGAVIAAGTMSAIVAHIFQSRIAYRSILVAPVEMATFVALLRATRSSQRGNNKAARKYWFVSGFSGGMGVHTYLAGIMMPFWVIGFTVHQYLFAAKRRWQNLLWTVLGLLLPLLVWVILIKLVPNLFFRVHAAGGDLPMTPQRFLDGFIGAFREFTSTGYNIPLYNTAITPFLGPFLVPFAILGVLLALWHWRRPEGALLLGGIFLFILPAGLSEDAMHPIRLIGTMPLLGVFTGWGVAWAAARISLWRSVINRQGIVRSGILLAGMALVIFPVISARVAFQSFFDDPTKYDPPGGWFNIPHNYAMALAEALTDLEQVTMPTYVSLSVLDTPIASYILQREKFPTVTTWARYGLHDLPDGQYFFPRFDLYHTPAQDDDPCMALLLPDKHTIVILPCDVNKPIINEITAQTHTVVNARGWQIADIIPVQGGKLNSPTLNLGDTGPEIGSGLRMVGEQTPPSIEPGKPASILLYWRVAAPQPTDIYSVAQVIGLGNQQFGGSDHHILPYFFPSARWQVGDIIPDRHIIPVSNGLPNGIFRFGVGAHVPPTESRLAVTPINNAISDLWLWHPMRRPAPILGAALPADAAPLAVKFDDHILLVGYQLVQTSAQWTLTLYWKTNAPPRGDYTIFVHVQDKPGASPILAQQDAKPLDGQLPTWAWIPGEIVTTTYNLSIPSGAIPKYIYVGMYPYPSFDRLGVQQDGQSAPDAADRRALVWSAN